MNELQSNLSQSRSDSQKNDGTAPGRADEWRSLVAAAVIGIFLIVAAQPGFGKTRKEAELTVESIPSGALVTIRKTSEPTKGTHRVVAGETPLSKRFKFSKKSTTWLQLEKRGFEAMTIEVNSTTGHVMARLIPVEDRSINELQPPPLVERISVLEPAFDVTLRKFSSEEHSDSKSASGRKALSETIRAQLSNYFTVVSDWTDSEEISLSSVWRDARSAMVLGDPIGHAYLAIAPRLETRTARRKLQQFGEELGIDALLIVAGHQNEETGGMKAGKVGIMVAGTAA
ncbi:MAG: hypothetical protein GY906_16335, partial [bacterium]|nr:hypothetical protein [bacterium]